MNQKSLKLNGIVNVIKSVCDVLFSVISFSYVARVLQVEKIGVYQFSATAVEYFLLISGLGISTYAIREGSYYRDNAVPLHQFVNDVFSINILSTFVSYILLAITLCVPFFKPYKMAICLLSEKILFCTLTLF